VGALGAVRALGAAIVVALALAGSVAAGSDPVAAVTSVSPRAVYFGDQVRATLRVVVDPARAKPESVSVDFPPSLYRRAGPPSVTQTAVGRTRVVTYVWTMQCLRGFCLPGARKTAFSFPETTVRYRLRGGATGSMTARWPTVLLGSRVTAVDIRGRVLRSGLDSLPAPAPHRSRASVVDVLSLVAGALAALAVGLAWLARPQLRRNEEVLTPLERALREAEHSEAGPADARRTALDGLARALDAVGDRRRANEARRLAWKEAEPAPDGIAALVGAVRGELRESA
jgi:hypothetical protein